MELDVMTGPEKGTIRLDTDDSFSQSLGRLILSGGLAITPLGGIVRPYTWAGVNPSVKGTLVEITADNTVNTSVPDAVDVVGIVYNSGVATGGTVLVVFTGVAEVLLKDGVAGVAGNWMGSHDVAGRARCQANPGAVGLHNQEIGHCILSVLAGVNVLTRCHLHFN